MGDRCSSKNMLYGTSEAEPQTDYVVAQLSQELYNSNLLLLLIQVRTFIKKMQSTTNLTFILANVDRT